MKFCRICGATLPDEAVFCTNCGSTYEQSEEINTKDTIDEYSGGTTVLGGDDDEQRNPRFKGPDNIGTNPDKEPSTFGGGSIIDGGFIAGGATAGTAGTETGGAVIGGGSVIDGGFIAGGATAGTETGGAVIGGETDTPLEVHPMSYDENSFFDTFASDKTKKSEKTYKIILIITIVASVVLLFCGSAFSVVDIIFYLVMTILFTKKKGWVIPLISTCYGAIFSIITLVAGGIPGGVFALIVGITVVLNRKKIDGAYKTYQTTGQLPNDKI